MGDEQLGEETRVPPELRELEGVARDADAGAAPPGGPPKVAAPAAPALTADELEAREWSMVPKTMGPIICRALPEVKDVWSEANALEWGRAMVPIARARGWTVGKFFEWAGPWVGLAIATDRMMWPTLAAGYARIKAARAAAAVPKKDDSPPPAPAPAP